MDDLISRQDVIDITWEEPSYTDPLNILSEIRDKIKSLPLAHPNMAIEALGKPEPKKGAWINEGRIIRCNRCKIGYATVKGMKSALTYKFCPNCGAKMEVTE